MDQGDDSGKAKQASEESESTGNKDKGKMVATNDYGIHEYFPGVEQPNFRSTLSIPPLNMSSHMVFEQQHYDHRPLPVVGNSSMSMASFMMEPPASDEYMQQYISELLDEKNKIDSNDYSANQALEYTLSFQELLGVGGGTGAVLQSSSVPAAAEESIECVSEYEDLQKWVAKVKESWAITGCSVVLDGWIDEQKNRTLMNVVVDSPLGSVYLKSLDVSFAVDNVEAMELVVEAVIQDVGPHNVVQIISYTTSPWLDDVAERIKARHEWMFWSVSATYCFSLILDKVASSVSWVQDTISKAKRVTRLVNTLEQLFKDNNNNSNNNNNSSSSSSSNSNNNNSNNSNNNNNNNSISNSNDNNYYRLVKFSKIRAAMPFLTLENMLLRRKHLQTIFTSQQFDDSSLGSSSRGRHVADLVVKDKSFWRRVMLVVKGGMPIVNLLRLMIEGKYDESRPQMGILYETMDQMKETIRDEIGKKKAQDIWDIIDEIWNGTLHSPLHAAAYYVNPKLFFTEDFLADSEVMSGLMTTILKLGGDQHTQALITQQLALYQNHIGDFKFGVKQADNFSPVEWWRQFGNQCPELQRFAIKVLGISCNGGSCYGLRRDVAEKLLSVSDTDTSSKMLKEQSFASYNLRLKELKQSGTINFNMEAEVEAEADELYPSNDWIVGE